MLLSLGPSICIGSSRLLRSHSRPRVFQVVRERAAGLAAWGCDATVRAAGDWSPPTPPKPRVNCAAAGFFFGLFELCANFEWRRSSRHPLLSRCGTKEMIHPV